MMSEAKKKRCQHPKEKMVEMGCEKWCSVCGAIKRSAWEATTLRDGTKGFHVVMLPWRYPESAK
jgi:hypothetical protein